MAEEVPFVVFGTLGVIGLVGWIVRPLLQSLGRRLEGSPAASPQLQAEVDELRGRVAELEERLDFTERMLAKAGPWERLPEGGQR